MRVRLLDHGQVGEFALETEEPIETRLADLPYHLEAMAGSRPTPEEAPAFTAFAAAGDHR